MEVLDRTEDALLQKNEAVVKGIFESKRKALLALQNFTVYAGNFTTQQLDATNEGIQSIVNLTSQQWEATLEGINALLAITLQNINAAISSTQVRIQVRTHK